MRIQQQDHFKASQSSSGITGVIRSSCMTTEPASFAMVSGVAYPLAAACGLHSSRRPTAAKPEA
ncbi:MAG: hypothetical protein IPM89_07720 [Candidatus Competibacteraceae bacterium]|nr:MAG: hypothetical protein IPM89_07720 [Candidatus Competibacteraceae bacterium]